VGIATQHLQVAKALCLVGQKKYDTLSRLACFVLLMVVVVGVRLVHGILAVVPPGIADIVCSLMETVIVNRGIVIVHLRIRTVVATKRLEDIADLAAEAAKSVIAEPTLGVCVGGTPSVTKASVFCKLADEILW
jgi:hypothetical protein